MSYFEKGLDCVVIRNRRGPKLVVSTQFLNMELNRN